jgi:ectoine hydroxylase-related dioxygenase (phytanoyl-CoA dioxygenase family)
MIVGTVNAPEALSPEQQAHYADEGYIILRNVFSTAEIQAAIREAESLLHDRTDLISVDNLRCRFMPHGDTGGNLFETFDPVIDIAPICAQFAADPRILNVLRAIYQDDPCLFKDKLIYKLPGTRGYGLHQDHPNWPGFPKSFVTVVIAYDTFDGLNGGTELFPRYHLQGSLSPDTESYRELTFDVINERSGVALELQPGDVAMFGCYVPHRSAPNRTNVCRRGLFLSYNAASEGGDQRSQHYDEFQKRMRERYHAQGRMNVYVE